MDRKWDRAYVLHLLETTQSSVRTIARDLDISASAITNAAKFEEEFGYRYRAALAKRRKTRHDSKIDPYRETIFFQSLRHGAPTIKDAMELANINEWELRNLITYEGHYRIDQAMSDARRFQEFMVRDAVRESTNPQELIVCLYELGLDDQQAILDFAKTTVNAYRIWLQDFRFKERIAKAKQAYRDTWQSAALKEAAQYEGMYRPD